MLLNPFVGHSINCTFKNHVENKTEEFRELHIGDKIPDVLLSNLVNSTISSKKLADFAKGKLLIIDFFATWCVPCIRALPDLDQFQKKYHEQLNILAITNEQKITVSSFLTKNSNMKGIGVTFMTGDVAFEKMFPHVEVPHEVWVDRHGIIRAITSGEYLTSENVADFVNGRLKELPVKKDMVDFDLSVPLFKNGNGGDGNEYLSRSILTKAMKGADSPLKYELDPDHNIKRILVVNHSALQIFYMAYSHLQFEANTKRLILDTKDSTKLQTIDTLSKQDEYFKYCYCYEYIPIHPDKPEIVFKSMLEDLNRYFSFYGTIVKKTMPCWVLVKTNKTDSLLHSSGGKKMYTADGKFRNWPLSILVKNLNRYRDMEPVIDETGSNQPVDMDLTFSRNVNHYPNIELIRSDLKKYGLDLIRRESSVDVLVIKDKQGSN